MEEEEKIEKRREEGRNRYAKEKKRKGKVFGLTTKQIAYMALRKDGMTITGATQELGLNPSFGSQLEKRIMGNYDLTDYRKVTLADDVMEKMLRGKKFGDIKAVKDSTVLEAAKMVYDRSQPMIQRTESVNKNINVNVDVSEYE